MKFLSYCSILAGTLLFTACGNDDCNTIELSADLAAAVSAYADANVAYIGDDSNENCIALRAAIDTYLETNASVVSCDNLLGVTGLQEAQITMLEEQRDGLMCM